MTTLIDPKMAANVIVGTAACPVCMLLGQDADSCRACLGNDHRVSHALCGRLSTQIPSTAGAIFTQPRLVKDLVANLISTRDTLKGTFALTGVTQGSGHGAVAHGLGPDDVLTTVCLVSGNVKIEVSYTGNDVRAAEQPGLIIGQRYSPLVVQIPDEVDQAARKLMGREFQLVSYDLGTRLPGLTFVRGKQLGSGALVGIRATISWNA